MQPKVKNIFSTIFGVLRGLKDPSEARSELFPDCELRDGLLSSKPHNGDQCYSYAVLLVAPDGDSSLWPTQIGKLMYLIILSMVHSDDLVNI